jgi:hypothetical protein
LTGRAVAGALALTLTLVLPARAQLVPEVPEAAADTAEVMASREILVMLRMPAPHDRSNARYGGLYGDAAAEAARKRAARQIAREHGLEVIESWPMPLIGVDCFVMRVPEGRSLEAAAAAVSRHRAVAWSQPLHIYETLAAEGPDPLFAVQPAATSWQLADLHEVATGRGITVAVIDTKVDVRHPDLAGQFVADRDFLRARPGTAEPHGTAIAGIISAKSGNGLGIVGVAPGARLMALRACLERRPRGGGAACDSLTLAKALHFALERGADVINMSLSGPNDQLLTSLIEVGLRKNIAIVAAFDPTRPGGGFPASLTGVYSVAEETLPSVPARVYRAPGRDVPTTQPGGRWYLVNGSSFAAAHVSGLLALLREERGSSASRLARSELGVVDPCATLAGPATPCPAAGRTAGVR